jgi:hypothetical protein
VPLMRVQSCCNHIKENVEKKFGKNAAKVFGEAAQQALEADFYSKLAGLLSMFIFLSLCECSYLLFFLSRSREAFQYVAQIDPAQYAKCFTNSTTGRTTSQLIESLWSALVPERRLPLTSMYLRVLKKFSKWTQKHR